MRTKPSWVNNSGAVLACGDGSVCHFRAGSWVAWPVVAATEVEAAVGTHFREQPHGIGAGAGLRINGAYFHDLDVVLKDLQPLFRRGRDYQARLGKPFPHEAYLSELAGLRDQLKTKLSAIGHGDAEGNEPTASELAERIKALKAANTIEATPQRVQRKQAAAEEPITARIRRRQEENATTDKHQAATDAASEEKPSTPNSPASPPVTFQERIERERQQQGKGQSPG